MPSKQCSMKQAIIAASMVYSLAPSAASASVTYTFELLSGGARYGNNTGGFSFTVDDFVKPITRFHAGAANIGGSEYGQTILLSSLSSCSVRDAMGSMPCANQNLLQGVTSYTADGRTYDVLQFGLVMYPQFSASYSNYYFDAGVFQKTGVFQTTLLDFERGRLTITENVSAVPEPGTWAMMLVGFGMVGGAARYRRRTTKIAYA